MNIMCPVCRSYISVYHDDPIEGGGKPMGKCFSCETDIHVAIIVSFTMGQDVSRFLQGVKKLINVEQDK